MKNYQNILIVRTDRIGDVILTTPALEAVRKNFPQAKISVLVAPLTKDLVAGNPYVNEVLVDDRKGVHRGVVGFWRMVSSLRRQKFDLAIIFHTKKRTNALCFLAGIPERVGYHNNKFGFLLTGKIKDTRPLGEKHESEYCLEVLRSLGMQAGPGQIYLPLQDSAERWAEYFFKKQPGRPGERTIAIHPGASGPEKRWSLEGFIELMNSLSQKYPCRFIIVGAVDIQADAARMQASLKAPCSDLTGQTSVSQLASLLKRCHMLVSNDSGPVHVAAAAGTPVVSIFTRNQPGINLERWRPLSPKAKGVSPPVGSSSPITVSQVLEAVDALFKLC
ncbi:MAG: hypothetical protein A2787_03780 [Omnitrophica WOR_2 bacterium RIFCSPHIGHO2_01_FULL_48_9]|nr:MAG: hypothetical protein A3D10_03010 [Omnitrophica WOR_2 bacterium RIFCSPHIGHO2_02_FULL_48_11]OGX33018.1 MAG: hypothetical protein A2787_03780 [Omnitrophica WOR_2 bacterium RIFCSPHIGHO2_01_FULL_48_9]